jgi:Pentatricopeptide repeat domain
VKLSDAGEMEKPPLRLFNSVVNACEICDEQELTLVVLDAMKKTHNTDGNLITFNIALKRLAKLGSVAACEGIIIGMLQQEVEPSVVSYTTAIAACALEGKKNPASAYQWLQRMRSRNVMPNVMSYNTALAACLDGKLSSTMLGSKIASEMLIDVGRQLAEGVKDDIYTTVFPDVYTKSVARQLMKQLRENWRNNEIDIRVAKATVRQPLLQLVDFRKSDQAAAVAVALESIAALSKTDEEGMDTTIRDEEELEYAAAAFVKRTAEV